MEKSILFLFILHFESVLGLRDGAVIGGAIAGTFVLILLLVLCWIFFMEQKSFITKLRERERLESGSQPGDNQDDNDIALYGPVTTGEDYLIKFNDIKILRKIGLGSLGEVFKAEFNYFDVAVKQLLGNITEEDIERFKEEARIMKAIPLNVNVVCFRGITCSPDPPCLVFEYCKDGNLSDYLKSDAVISKKEKIDLAIDIAAGMHHLHTSLPGKEIIHRGLSSRKIMLKDGKMGAVNDFGMAVVKDQKDKPTEEKNDFSIKNLKWMAPESMTKSEYSVKSDVYSYGMVLYEIVSRKTPFEDFTSDEAKKLICEGKRPEIPIDMCPPVLEYIMTLCWKDNPEERPTFAQILRLLNQTN